MKRRISQCSTILRYVLDTDIKEVFAEFDVLDDRTSEGAPQCVFKNGNEYGFAGKLVAQTYDGAIIMASNLNGVQSKIKEKIPTALFTHCGAPKLNLLLS